MTKRQQQAKTRRLERVLRYVNRLRGRLGRKPLKRLPKGEMGHEDSSPVTIALCCLEDSNASCLSFYDDHPISRRKNLVKKEREAYMFYGEVVVTVPKYIEIFMDEFHEGLYPELVKK